MEALVYQTSPRVTIATNQFINVPVILQFDDLPLISVVQMQHLGYTTEIPIYHSDGTYLAKVNGTRIYPTEDGKKAGIIMRSPVGMSVCEMDGRTLFEVVHESGDAFRMKAELHTPTGYFIKCADTPLPDLLRTDGSSLQVGGIQMSGNLFQGCRIGIWLKSDGSCGIGCG